MIVKDTTLPALWECLSENPRGVMIAVDELASMFLQTTPAQRQTYCDVYQCGSRTVHRKSGKRGPIIIPRTFATVCGGIQPDLFHSIRGTHDGGLIERFLICGQSERSLPPLVDNVLDPDAETAWHLSVVALLSIERAEYRGPSDHHGSVPFSRAAFDRLKTLHDVLETHLISLNVHIKYRGIVRKLTANAARLALIRRCLRWSSGEFGFFGPIGMIEEEDADAACRAAEFFLSRYLAWRPEVLETEGESAVPPPPVLLSLLDRILGYAKSKGRTEFDVRWLRQQTLEGNPSTEEIRAALDEAVDRGSGSWKDPGRKTFVCR